MARKKHAYIDDSFKKTFWRKVYALSARLGDGLSLYRISTRFLYFLFGRQAVQTLIYRRRRPRVFRQLLDEIDVPEANREDVVREVLAEDYKDRLEFENTVMVVSNPEILDKLIFEQGTVNFERARQSGRGIIMLGFYHGPRLAFWEHYLANFAVPVHVFNGGLDRKYFLRLDREQERTERAMIHLAELREMQKILNHGGVVWINPEGGQGQKGVEMPIFGRKMLFRTGFIELALRTNALLLPLTGRKLKNGDIHLLFRPPYQPAAGELTHEETVRHLMSQHVATIEELWTKYPEQIMYRAGVRFVNVFPLIDE